jgi:para-aminobenzoate synthetase component I
MHAKDVTGIINEEEILQTIRGHEDAVIVDDLGDGVSVFGFPCRNQPPYRHIAIDLLEEFYHAVQENTPEPGKKHRKDSPARAKFGPGWYGYFSYDLKNQLYRLKARDLPTEFPLINFFYLPVVFQLNHKTGQMTCLGTDASLIDDAIARIKQNTKRTTSHDYSLTLDYLCPFSYYKTRIERIRQEIIDGNVYQVNYAHRVRFSFSGEPFDCYRAISKKAEPAHGAYLRFGDLHILSFSPERFFKIEHGIIESCPIKGTMPRSPNKQHDLRYKKQLEQSIKDKAEHLMIVDLIRNDLGKICKIGSIQVKNLFNIESFQTIHHMVSSVSGALQDSATLVDIIKAVFPGGSITGAPKIAAMNFIEELEEFNREIYTGSIGYIGADSMDFNIAIRTLVIHNNVAYYDVGGGIVFDSDPWKEYQETLTKSRIVGL